MKIAIGADHRGAGHANTLIESLRSLGHEVVVPVELCEESCDYPDSAFAVASLVRDGAADRGILLCGSGVGMSMAANKVDGVRAANVDNSLSAEMSRRHNKSNVLCLSADTLSMKDVAEIVRSWMKAEFEGGRHERRVNKLALIERGEDPRG